MTRRVTSMLFPIGKSFFAFMSDTPLHSIKSLEQQVLKDYSSKNETQQQLIEVRIMHMMWFHAEQGNFKTISRLLTNHKNVFYDSLFIKLLLEFFWAKVQREILVFQFLPYLVQTITAIMLMHYQLSRSRLNEDEDTTVAVVKIIFTALTLLLMVY
jgi:hypothetical protein